MIPDIFIDADVYSEGDSYIGTCETVTVPKFIPKFHEIMASGMLWQAKVNNYRLEEPEIELEMINKPPEFLRYVDIRPGASRLFTFKAATSDEDGTTHGWKYETEVRFGGADYGGLKAGDPSKTKSKSDVIWCKITRDGEVEAEFRRGPPAACEINGVDMLADLNRVLERA